MGFLGKSNGKSGAQNNAGLADDLPIQTKLRYGQKNDSYEQEADRVADTVVSNSGKSNAGGGASAAMAPSISNYVQKQGSEEETKDAAQPEGDEKKEESPTEKAPEEEVPAQKKEDVNPEEKEPVQKKEEDKKEEPVQKKGEEKDEENPVQKAATENKDEEKQVQKQEDSSKKEEEKPVQKKDDKVDEKDPVQKKEDKKEEPVQKKEESKEEEKPVQKKAEESKDEEKPVQKKESNNSKAEDPTIEKDIQASKSGGKPMEDDVRIEMEKQFGKDFKNVKIHNDPMAFELCNKIHAQAFTHGNHIYFSEGKYNPSSTEGKRLLAHELTHVVQQGHDVRRKMIQKKDPEPESEKKDEFEEDGLGKLKKNPSGELSEVALDHIKVPILKENFGPKANEKITRREPRPTDQAQIWEDKVKLEEAAAAKLDQKMSDATKDYPEDLKAQLKNKSIYFLKKKGAATKKGMMKGLIIGSKADVLKKMKRPQWGKKGENMTFDVDHQQEYQLGGAHTIENMWLLFSPQNQTSGREVKESMIKQLNQLVEKAKPTMGALPTGRQIKSQYDVTTLKGVKGDSSVKPSGKPVNYTLDEVKRGDQLEGLDFLNKDEIEGNNLLGTKDRIAIYTSASGGGKVDVDFKEKDWGGTKDVNQSFGNVTLNKVTYHGPDKGNSVNLTFGNKLKKYFKDGKAPTFDAQLASADFVAYGGVLNHQSIIAQLKANPPSLVYFSPFSLDTIDISENGLEGAGKLKTSIALIDNLDIDIVVNGEGIWLSKTFSTGELKIPPPFKIEDCSFTVMLGTGGIDAYGEVVFGIANIGTGTIKGKKLDKGFALEGSFELDKKIFDGKVDARYENNAGNEKWRIDGEVKFKKGSITGVKSGTIKVGYDGKILTAKGDAQLEAKWIEKGSLEAEVGDDKFRIAGKFTLAKMPGLESGEGEVSVEKSGDGEYQLKAKGKAKSSIKVVNAELSIEYDKGILTVNGSVAYSKGIFSGNIFITVTNGPPPAEAPNAGGADGDFRVYGGGELTAQITSWLKGTIGVKFDENNQVIFSGKLALTSSIEVFGKKSMPEKDLFSMGFDIPIFAIPVGPKSIGLKARIEGALVAYAFVGPGTLEGVELGVTFNPDKPDDTVVTGKGKFVVPAEAGLKLAVRASIGLSALIGGVEGGIELAGGVKLEAKASAGIEVNWTPATGLELDAKLEADVTPKLTFEINGFIKAWVAWYDKIWKWNLANYEYGSNLNLGITLPVKYKEGQDFNVNYQDITFRKPDIDPKAVLRGVISDIKNKRN